MTLENPPFSIGSIHLHSWLIFQPAMLVSRRMFHIIHDQLNFTLFESIVHCFRVSTIGVSRSFRTTQCRSGFSVLNGEQKTRAPINREVSRFGIPNARERCNGNRTSELFLQTPWFAMYLEVSFSKYKFMTL